MNAGTTPKQTLAAATRSIWILASAAAGLLCSACSTMTSTQESPPTIGVGGGPVVAGSVSDGLPYYLPRRPILLSVAVDKGTSIPTLTVNQGVMEPDLAHRFTLKYGQNYVGTNAIVVGVNSKGLLQSANGSITSSTGQIATNLGSTLGAIGGLAAGVVGGGPPCVPGQTYSYIYHPDAGSGPWPLACGITVTIVPGAMLPAKPDVSREPGNGKAKAGIFFRQEIAYVVEGKDSSGALLGRWPAYSPDQSDIFFYPVTETVFASSHTNFVFSDGVVTNIDQTSDSEINGVLQIPANILTGYTTALGQVFSAFNTDRTDKVTAAVSASKLQYCQSVIAANPLSGKSSADMATAEANIKAACQ